MLLRAIYITIGAAFILVSGLFHFNHANSLPYALCLATSVLLLRYSIRPLKSIKIIDMWFMGFLYFYLSEYLLGFEPLLKEFDEHIVYQVCNFTTAAFGATVMGYGLIVSNNFQFDHKSQRAGKKYQSKIEKKKLPANLYILWIVYGCFALFYIFVIITPQQLLSVARSQRVMNYDIGYFSVVLSSSLVIFPIISIYFLKRYRYPALINLAVALIFIVCVVSAYLLGSRNIIGFIASSSGFLLLDGLNHITRKQMVLIIAVLSILVVAQGIMKYARVSSFISKNTSESFHRNLTELVLSNEGTLRIDALVFKTEPYQDENPLENLFIFLWWIPRTIWPEKPTMGGHWFIREYTHQSGFGEQHSISGGFAFAALLDFGPAVAIPFCVMYGLVIGVIENFVGRNRSIENGKAAIAGLFIFGVFFMVRSFYTSLILILITTLFAGGPFIIIEKLSKLKITGRAMPKRIICK